MQTPPAKVCDDCYIAWFDHGLFEKNDIVRHVEAKRNAEARP